MFRSFAAAALLALAAPAQWIGPTNLLGIYEGFSTFESGGKLFAIVWSRGFPVVKFDREKQGRVDVELLPVSVLAIDSRPCASDACIGIAEAFAPIPGWCLTGGMLWSSNVHRYPLHGMPDAPERTYWFTYDGGYSEPWTRCRPPGRPELMALLCEVRLR